MRRHRTSSRYKGSKLTKKMNPEPFKHAEEPPVWGQILGVVIVAAMVAIVTYIFLTGIAI